MPYAVGGGVLNSLVLAVSVRPSAANGRRSAAACQCYIRGNGYPSSVVRGQRNSSAVDWNAPTDRSNPVRAAVTSAGGSSHEGPSEMWWTGSANVGPSAASKIALDPICNGSGWAYRVSETVARHA